MTEGSERRILLSPPDVGDSERDALLRAFDGGWIAPLGPEVDAFEAELAAYTGAEDCAALSSGSAALELALLAVGVGPADEVVVQSATFAASAFAVVHVGATPILFDVDRRTWGLDADRLAAFLHERAEGDRLPAAVLAVDLYGMCPDFAALRKVCGHYSLPLIEDAAEGLGSVSDDTNAGMLADLGALSFNGNKIITTSGGGALLGPRDTMANVRYLATQARQPVPHFEHREVGFNYRMSNLLAALGRAQLAGLDPKIDKRNVIFDRYSRDLPDIEWLSSDVTDRSNRWLSVGLLPEPWDPGDVCERLNAAGIEARRAFKPMHLQPVFIDADTEMIGGLVSEELFDRGICLPSGSTLTDEDQDYVIASLTELLEERPTSAATITR